MMSWVEEVECSIPDHAKDIKINLVATINNSVLDPVDAHACAFIAAIVSGNGMLAQEIEMNGPLFVYTAEREAAKTAASLISMLNTWYSFVELADDVNITDEVSGLSMGACNTRGGVSKKKFEMYALTASIVGRCSFSIRSRCDKLRKEGTTTQELLAIGRIAATVSAIGKVVPV